MTKNKSLFKNISIFLCLIPMLILSLFCLIPSNKIDKVKADYVVENFTFLGSDIIVPYTHQYGGSYQIIGFANLSFRFSLDTAQGYSFNISGSVNALSSTSLFTVNATYDSRTYTNNAFTTGWDPNMTYLQIPLIGATSGNYLPIFYVRSANFGSNIVKVRLFKTEESPYRIYNNICYFDDNGGFIRFAILSEASVTSYDYINSYSFEDRVYYLTSNFNDNFYYESGYNDGYNVGKFDGEDIGYTDGYNAGVDIGYGNGYNDGVEDGGNYTFLSLIGAVIDAPVSAFTSLLNFNVLGINILAFITGLLTIAIFIFVIKIMLGGK